MANMMGSRLLCLSHPGPASFTRCRPSFDIHINDAMMLANMIILARQHITVEEGYHVIAHKERLN
jgi:hypothetical protein